MLKLVTLFLGFNMVRIPPEKIWGGCECSGEQMRADNVTGKRSVDPNTSLLPTISEPDKPSWTVEIDRLTKAEHHVIIFARSVGSEYVSANIPSGVVPLNELTAKTGESRLARIVQSPSVAHVK